MTGPIDQVIAQLRTLIATIDQAAATTHATGTDATQARAIFTAVAVGTDHPLMRVARQQTAEAAGKTDKLARLLTEAATAFAEYANIVAPGAVPLRVAAEQAMPPGQQIAGPHTRGPLARRLLTRMATTDNADDGLQGAQTIANEVQSALQPGGVAIPPSPREQIRAADDTSGAQAGDLLLAAFTLAIMGMKAAEAAARLRRIRPRAQQHTREGDEDG